MKPKLKKFKHKIYKGFYYKDKNGNYQGQGVFYGKTYCNINTIKNQRTHGIVITIRFE